MASPMTVTASTASAGNGILLRVLVLTGAADGSAQTGATAAAGITSGAEQKAITTTATGSKVYGSFMRDSSATAFTANASTTLDDNLQDTTNARYYATCETTTATGTPGSVTVGASAPSGIGPHGTIALAEILANGTLTTDASSPSSVSGTTGGNVTTASFTPPDGALLVAMTSFNATSGATMTVSGGGFTWTALAEQAAAGFNYSGVWIAQVPAVAPPSTEFIVTANQGGSTSDGIAMRVEVLTGAADITMQTGAVASQSGVQQTAITTTASGSMVYGSALASGTLTANGSTTLIDDLHDGVNAVEYGTFKSASATSSPGSETIGSTFVSAFGGVALAEILPYDTSGATPIAEDASGPAFASATATTTVSTALFLPPYGAILVALISSNGGAGVCTVTVLGGGLTWNEVALANAAGDGYAGVWLAQVPQQKSADMSGYAPGWFPG